MKRLSLVLLILLVVTLPTQVSANFAVGLAVGSAVGSSSSKDTANPSAALPITINDTWLYLGFYIDHRASYFLFWHRQQCKFYMVHSKDRRQKYYGWDKKDIPMYEELYKILGKK